MPRLLAKQDPSIQSIRKHQSKVSLNKYIQERGEKERTKQERRLIRQRHLSVSHSSDSAAAPSPARITTMSPESATMLFISLQLRRCLRPCQINDHAGR
ncbi:hypothetical protein HDV63DRAFT_146456 [Trichoderma sp. SZMC 28014]